MYLSGKIKTNTIRSDFASSQAKHIFVFKNFKIVNKDCKRVL